jgi:hypothetical protein
VDQLLGQPDLPEAGADVLPKRLVVVTRDEDHVGPVAGAPQDLLDHGVLGCGPIDATAHAPEVHDVAHQEEVLGLVLVQEVEQALCLAGAGPQVDV